MSLQIKPAKRKSTAKRTKSPRPEITQYVEGVPAVGSTIWSFVSPNDREYEVLLKQLEKSSNV